VPSRPRLSTDPAPQTAMEQMLAEIWVDLLGVEQVGVHESFLELGGTSLTMVQVMSALEQRTGVKLDFRALSHQTLGQLAVLCEERIAEARARPSGLWSRLRGWLSKRGRSTV